MGTKVISCFADKKTVIIMSNPTARCNVHVVIIMAYTVIKFPFLSGTSQWHIQPF